MAIKLENKPNVIAPGGAYPYGDIKDNDGSNNGTPINRATHADFHQFFARMLALSGITANGLPDNNTNGFQYYEALVAAIGLTYLNKGENTTTAWNSLTLAGIFTKTNNNGSADSPDNALNYFNILVVSGDATIRQVAFHPSLNIIYTRLRYIGTWSSWSKILNSVDISLVLSSTLEAAGGIRTALSGVYLKTSIISIGDWNMDSDSSKSVSLGGIDFKKIRSVSGVIRNDDDDTYYPLASTTDNVLTGETPTIAFQAFQSGSISLLRVNSSLFDSTNFDSTSYNRGWITVTHEA